MCVIFDPVAIYCMGLMIISIGILYGVSRCNNPMMNLKIGDKIQIDENTIFQVKHSDFTFKDPLLCDGMFWYMDKGYGIEANNIPVYVLDNMVNQKIWRIIK